MRSIPSASARCATRRRGARSLGHVVEEARPDYDAEALGGAKFTSVLAAGAAWAIADWERRTGRTAGPAHFEPFVWAFAERGRSLGAGAYLLAVQDMQRAMRDMSAFFTRFDLWPDPDLGQPPVELGTLVYRGGDPFELRRRCARFSPYTWIGNASGQPRDLPCRCTGRPRDFRWGVHFTGPLGRGGDPHPSGGPARTRPTVGGSAAPASCAV